MQRNKLRRGDEEGINGNFEQQEGARHLKILGKTYQAERTAGAIYPQGERNLRLLGNRDEANVVAALARRKVVRRVQRD